MPLCPSQLAAPRMVAVGWTLFAALLPLPALAQTLTPEARAHFTQARHAQDANQLDQAAKEYAQTIRLAPSFAGAYTNLGLIQYVQGNFKPSSETLAQAVRLDPNLVGANLYLGIDLLKLNQPAHALPYLQRAAELDPNSKDAQSWLGTAYWQAAQPWTALEQLRQANARFPNDPDLLFVLGEAYRKTADAELQSLFHTASGTPFVHRLYGDIYLDQHAFAKAARHYQAALAETPAPPHIDYQLGEVELAIGNPEQAAEHYRKQLQLTPADAPAKARLAQTTLLLSGIPATLQLLTEALAISPLETVSALHLPPSFATANDTPTEQTLTQLRVALPLLQASPKSPARNLALTLVAANLNDSAQLATSWAAFTAAIPLQPPAPTLLGQAQQNFDRQSYETAAAQLHTWLQTHPGDLDARYLAARAHRLLSLAILDTLLVNHPDSFRSHQLLAQTYEGRDEDDKAIAEYAKVEQLSPTLPGIHYALGHLFLKDGNLERATTEFQGELRLAPGQPEANAELGMTLLAQDQPAAAVPYLTTAIALSPDLWTAHQQLGKALYLQKNYPAARRELTLALVDDPQGLAHYQLALVYKALGDTEAATREFNVSRQLKADRLAEAKIETPADAGPGTRND